MRQKPHNLVETIEFVRANHLSPFAEVVGRWVWLTFTEKPGPAIRERIKSFGFRWVQRRGRWAHSCGHPSRQGVHDPRRTYGAVPVDMVRTDDLLHAA